MFVHTCEELQEVVEHVGDSQHHLREQPGGGDLRGAVLHKPHRYDSQRQVRLDHPTCSATAIIITAITRIVTVVPITMMTAKNRYVWITRPAVQQQ